MKRLGLLLMAGCLANFAQADCFVDTEICHKPPDYYRKKDPGCHRESVCNPGRCYWFERFIAMIGYDEKWMHMKLHSDFTTVKGVIPENYLGGFLYAGPRFDNDFAIEVGWDFTHLKNRTAEVSPGETFGTAVVTGEGTVKTSVIMFGIAFDVLHYWTLTPRLEVFALVGLGLIKASISMETQSGAGIPDSFRGKTRMIPRAGLGIQWFFYDKQWGLRLKGQWEANSNSRIQQKNTGINYKLFKDSVTAGLGIFGQF